MEKNSPAILPGKRLWKAHFDPIATATLDKKILKKELSPLFTMAKKYSWCEDTKIEDALMCIETSEYKNIFELVKTWHQKLDAKNEEHSKALAAWIMINNLEMVERMRLSYKKPYLGLRNENLFILKVRTAEAINLEKIYQKDISDLEIRHSLALVIVSKIISTSERWGPKSNSNDPNTYNDLKRFLLDKEIYKTNPSQQKNNIGQDWLLSPVYGFSKQGEWVEPSIKKVKLAIPPILNSLPQLIQKEVTERIERKKS